MADPHSVPLPLNMTPRDSLIIDNSKQVPLSNKENIHDLGGGFTIRESGCSCCSYCCYPTPPTYTPITITSSTTAATTVTSIFNTPGELLATGITSVCY